jgi:hypothetical protein
MSNKKVLLVGLNPAVVDYNDPVAVLNTNASKESLQAEAERARKTLADKGCDVRWSFWEMRPDSLQVLIDTLKSFQPDIVMLGAGVRLNPKNTLIFESCVNAVRAHAPQAVFCFNAGPEDMLGPVVRQL